jgi:hypothetical protein
MALSDRGSIATGTLERDESGAVTSATLDTLTPLKDISADTLKRFNGDAEGLALAPNGTAFISFEGNHRVWSYATPTSNAVALPQHADFPGFQLNSSLETLAIDRDGSLYTLPERSGSETRDFPVYRFKNGAWTQPFTLPRRDAYLPAGMDIGPDGKLYIVERWFRGIGFSSRVRRFDMSNNGLTNEVTLIESSLGAHDNLEGIAVWHDGEHIRLTMISDDNFKIFQVTEFVDYVVTE